MIMDKLKKEFASKLLKVKAIKLQPNDPFTWASGWKSPFYCDNRKKLKYHHRPDTGNYLGRLIASKGIESDFFKDIDAIIPIPITKSRRKTRGYNQSEEIAKGIQERTHLPIITDAIRRVTFTESQTQKDRWQRLENVKHVFQLSDTYHDKDGKHPITDLAGKHLLIIDDVCTTGATLISCCEELQKAGKMKFSIATIGWAAE